MKKEGWLCGVILLFLLISLSSPIVSAGQYSECQYGESQYGSNKCTVSGGRTQYVYELKSDCELMKAFTTQQYFFKDKGSRLRLDCLPRNLGQHSVTVESWNTFNKEVTLIIQSNAQKVTMKSSGSKKFDLDGDGTYDIQLVVGKISPYEVPVKITVLDGTEPVSRLTQLLKTEVQKKQDEPEITVSEEKKETTPSTSSEQRSHTLTEPVVTNPASLSKIQEKTGRTQIKQRPSASPTGYASFSPDIEVVDNSRFWIGLGVGLFLIVTVGIIFVWREREKERIKW